LALAPSSRFEPTFAFFSLAPCGRFGSKKSQSPSLVFGSPSLRSVKPQLSRSMAPRKPIVQVKINEFRIEEMPIACGMAIIAPSGMGKTVLAENIIFYRKNLYPVGQVYIGSEDDYHKLKKIFHSLFVCYGLNEEQLTEFVKRCQDQAMKYPQGAPERRAFLWFDDLSDDSSVWKTRNVTMLVKKSRHWDLLSLWCTQACKDFPPAFRTNIAYVAMGRNYNEEERKKLWAFATICGTQKKFYDLMDQVTGNHTFLIIKQRSDSNAIEDCVFWYQTVMLKPWEFGCKEYRKWGEMRYNPAYQEQIFD